MKTGLPSLCIVVVTALIFVFPAKASIGILLPMLIIGDIFAVTYYRRHAVWKYLVGLLPWVLLGIIMGYFVTDVVSSAELKPLICAIVLVIIVLHVIREMIEEKFNNMLPKLLWFTIYIVILGGLTMMV